MNKTDTPEQKARVIIDKTFADAGWKVISRDEYSPTINAAAICEGILEGNLEADYLLFINGKAVGVLEAKREEIDVDTEAVRQQAEKYCKKVTHNYQTYRLPLPVIYLSNGKDLLYKDNRNENNPYTELGHIHTPKELVKILSIPDPYAGLPTLTRRGLRDCQYEAVSNLETSFRTGQNRALMVLATGAGKTYTACLSSYRFLAFTPMRRVLFLVDRNNLGGQAEAEFGMFRLTENGDPFNSIFTVNRVRSSNVPSDSNVVISTIQRLFSILKGEEVSDDDDDEGTEDPGTEVTLSPNPMLPQDFFDLIIIDECHRSIYGNWKKVLEYFNKAKMIGLTATPVPETLAFFNNNLVVNYTLEKSIIDGVNVDSRIYRIKTSVSENGGAILEGSKYKEITKYTGHVEDISSVETKTYSKEELNRSIINPSQIKLILETYRDAIYSEMFTDPQREPTMDYIPKTLIFALNENHATNIVTIAKEVFGRSDGKYVQKITYSSGDSNRLIRQFRNDKDFRIAVTCTLVATGTDIKPLEVVMFMRDVASETLYVQMKGRGVRTIGDDILKNVTPNAVSKDFYYLVDAVGVTEHEHVLTGGDDDEHNQTITFKELLERITHGNVNDDYLRLLASKLSRIHNKADESQRNKFISIAGVGMRDIASTIFSVLERCTLPPYVNINEPNNERKGLVACIANNAEVRKYLLILNEGFIDVLLPGEDELIFKGFSKEEAQETTSAFEDYCNTHKDEIEALRLIYNNDDSPLTYQVLSDLEKNLKEANSKFTRSQLWNSYSIVEVNKVKKCTTKEEKDSLTNIIQLVRFAYHITQKLESLYPSANQRFNLWCGQLQREISESQISLISKIVNYIASNGACNVKEISDIEDPSYAAQLITSFGGKDSANKALESLASFIIYRKTA